MQRIRRLLIIEKNEELLNILSDQIQLTGEFDIHSCQTPKDADEIIKAKNIEIILFSHTGNLEETVQSCRMWRDKNINTPIFIITNIQDDSEAVRLLDAGANDYLSKPFRMTLLVARLRAHLRQYDRSTDAILAIGPYWFRQDIATLINKDTDEEIRLTDKEAHILRHLYHAAPNVVGRSKLLDEVWGYTGNISTHTLETHIYRLRQKIEIDPHNASILVTENRGYRLNL